MIDQHTNKVYRYLLNRPNCRTTLEDVDDFVRFHVFHTFKKINYILS